MIESAKSSAESQDSSDLGRLQKWLEGLTEEQMGKYKM